MKTKNPILCYTLFAAALSLTSAGSLAAQSPTAGPTADVRSDMKLKHSDETFFEKAAKSGMKEVSVSQAVLPNLKNAQVKQFAEMMVNDHSTANSELIALATKKGVSLPAKEPKLDNKWTKADKDLDEDYMETMVSDHKDAVDLFEKATKSDDAEIAAFAQKTLPTLQHHLDRAKELKKIVD